MKKIISIAIGLILALSCYCVFANDNDLIQDGTYVQMGSYRGEPILWRCVSTSADDENGKLIISDKILCFKAFDSSRIDETLEKWETQPYKVGNSYWPESNIRAWLNSEEKGGNVVWPGNNPPHSETRISYDQEDGFLSDTNFSSTELSAIKPVSQWLILNSYHKEDTKNGVEHFFETNENVLSGSYERFRYTTIRQLNHIEGAMGRVTDSVFLLDEQQIYPLWQKYDSYAEPTESAWAEFSAVYDTTLGILNIPNRYWLRTSRGIDTATYIDGELHGSDVASFNNGIRPAFYLNEDNVCVISGSGEWNDPYVIDGMGQEGTAVFSKSAQLKDAQVSMIDDEMFVSVRDVFESFGADVQYYDEEDGIITADNGESVVVLQIGNVEIGNGTEVFTLDSAPVIVNDRAMISLEGIEDAYDCDVEYLEDKDQIVIDKPEPQDFGDSYGYENWQINRADRNGNYDPDELRERMYGTSD